MASICTHVSPSIIMKYIIFSLLWVSSLYWYIRFLFSSCCVLLSPHEFNAYCKGHIVRIAPTLVGTYFIDDVNSEVFYTACVNKLYVMFMVMFYAYVLISQPFIWRDGDGGEGVELPVVVVLTKEMRLIWYVMLSWVYVIIFSIHMWYHICLRIYAACVVGILLN